MRLANARRVPRRWRSYDLAYRGRRLSRLSAVGLQVKTRRSGYARSVSHPRHPGRIHGQHLPPITEPRVQHGEPAHEQADQVGLLSPGRIHVNDDIGRRLRLQKGGDIFRNVRRRVTARGKGYAMEALRKEIRLRFATPVVTANLIYVTAWWTAPGLFAEQLHPVSRKSVHHKTTERREAILPSTVTVVPGI